MRLADMRRRLGVLGLCLGLFLLLPPEEAHAGQATASNPPAALRPGQTKTPHELGASVNGGFGPDALFPSGHWRMHFPSTGKIGQLSGLWIGLDAGPTIRLGDVDLDLDRPGRGGVWGHTGFEIGYEIDPWSNLALTISPVLHNDFHFGPNRFRFVQTFGPVVRLYINQHWVVYVEPGCGGWNLNTHHRSDDIDDIRAGFSYRGGMGFAYKF